MGFKGQGDYFIIQGPLFKDVVRPGVEIKIKGKKMKKPIFFDVLYGLAMVQGFFKDASSPFFS